MENRGAVFSLIAKMQLGTVDYVGICSEKQNVKGAQGHAGRCAALQTLGFFAVLYRELLFEQPGKLT